MSVLLDVVLSFIGGVLGALTMFALWLLWMNYKDGHP